MINACTLALLNTGAIQMRGVVCAVGIALLSGQDMLVLDPGPDEPSTIVGSGCFAFLVRGGEAESVWSHWMGARGGGAVERARALAKEGIAHVWERMRESVPEMEKRVIGVEMQKGKGKSKAKVKHEDAMEEDMAQ